MRIIERGEIPSERVHEVRCSNCYSKIEFQEHEAKKTYDQRDGNYMIIECPVCNDKIYKAI